MAERMRHPGPRAAERHVVAPASLREIGGTLRRGETVMAEVARIFGEQGCFGGVIWLDGLVCEPMRYVLPALSTDGLHAAWYSETHAPEGEVTILSSTAMVGWRDGAPFLHCHGIWRGQAGGQAMGHLLPFDTRIARDIEVRGLGSADAGFVARPDPETAFTLFSPEPAPASQSGAALFLRLLPSEDVVSAIEAVAAAHDIRNARLHGIGSIDHVVFEDGRRMDCLATELRLTSAEIADGIARIEIDVVDIHGTIASGRIARGQNPVGVTLEALIEPVSTPPTTLEGQT